MKCPRGDHGEMFYEDCPIRAHRCEACGHMEYPVYKGNVRDGGYGAQRRLSKADKRRMMPAIEYMVDREWTNQEMQDATGLPLKYIQGAARTLKNNMPSAEKA